MDKVAPARIECIAGLNRAIPFRIGPLAIRASGGAGAPCGSGDRLSTRSNFVSFPPRPIGPGGSTRSCRGKWSISLIKNRFLEKQSQSFHRQIDPGEKGKYFLEKSEKPGQMVGNNAPTDLRFAVIACALRRPPDRESCDQAEVFRRDRTSFRGAKIRTCHKIRMKKEPSLPSPVIPRSEGPRHFRAGAEEKWTPTPRS